MSLQGTLDTFALADVLRLLASTRKTGYLRLEGSRGSGGLWLSEGALSAVSPLLPAGPAEPVAPGAEALCDVLRAPDGSFAFEAGATTALDAGRADVAVLLDEAEELLVEWRELTVVVPALGCALSLAPVLGDDTAVVTAAQWRLVVAIGGGTTVGALGSQLALGELAVSRTVKSLVEAGLAVVGPVPARDAAPQPVELPGAAVEPVHVVPVHVEVVHDEPVLDEAAEHDEADERNEAVAGEGAGGADVVHEVEVEAAEVEAVALPEEVQGEALAVPTAVESSPDGFLRRPLGARPAGPRGPGLGVPLSASLGELASLSPGTRPFPGAAPQRPQREDEGAEVARRLADLGPGAAAAVAAAAEAGTPEARAEAIDAIVAEADGQPVNRSALLKFLSSVRS